MNPLCLTKFFCGKKWLVTCRVKFKIFNRKCCFLSLQPLDCKYEKCWGYYLQVHKKWHTICTRKINPSYIPLFSDNYDFFLPQARVSIYEDFLSDRECEHLISLVMFSTYTSYCLTHLRNLHYSYLYQFS